METLFGPEPEPREQEPQDEFDEFWSHWPRRVAKKAAARAWVAAMNRGDSVEQIARGLFEWLDYWKKTGTEARFVPHAATWLNQERYKEEPV